MLSVQPQFPHLGNGGPNNYFMVAVKTILGTVGKALSHGYREITVQ